MLYKFSFFCRKGIYFDSLSNIYKYKNYFSKEIEEGVRNRENKIFLNTYLFFFERQNSRERKKQTARRSQCPELG